MYRSANRPLARVVPTPERATHDGDAAATFSTNVARLIAQSDLGVRERNCPSAPQEHAVEVGHVARPVGVPLAPFVVGHVHEALQERDNWSMKSLVVVPHFDLVRRPDDQEVLGGGWGCSCQQYAPAAAMNPEHDSLRGSLAVAGVFRVLASSRFDVVELVELARVVFDGLGQRRTARSCHGPGRSRAGTASRGTRGIWSGG